MGKLKAEHFPGLVRELKAGLVDGTITVHAAREFCDDTFNMVQEHQVQLREAKKGLSSKGASHGTQEPNSKAVRGAERI